MSTAERDVLDAAAGVVTAFGSHDTARYFAGFAEDATFVFHASPAVLRSRAEYQALWAQWEREDGFRVLTCESTDQRVQVLGDVAVLTHAVRTVVRDSSGEQELRERESIVFARRDGRWVAVHEHLSPDPGTG